MRLGRMAVGVVATAALALPAWAQGSYKPTGTRIDRPAPAQASENRALSDVAKARVTVGRFADCIVRTDEKQTRRFLAAKAQSPEADKIIEGLATPECLMDGALRMPKTLLRGAIFRSVYERDFAASALKFPERPLDYAAYVDDQKSPDSTRYLILMDFADCVARADATNVRAFVLAGPASATETGALARLQPQFGPCFPVGAKVTFNRSVLSAILAEALYREVEAGQQNPAEALN